MITIAFGVFGLIIGSFLNVLVLRWGERPLTGRSACAACGSVIRWYDLVPIVSWVLLRGRCRDCGAHISIQYALVEMATGIIFALIGTATIALIFRVLALPIAALLIAIAVYDLRHTLIPDAWVYLAAFAALAHSLSAVVLGFSENVPVVLIVGPVVSLPLFTIWLISRGAWMGFGDVKLALVMGWLLGLVPGLQALFFAFVLGALVSVPLLFFSSPAWSRIQTIITPTRTSSMQRLGFTMKSEVPFGPFLIAATFIVWISNMHGFSLFDVLL